MTSHLHHSILQMKDLQSRRKKTTPSQTSILEQVFQVTNNPTLEQREELVERVMISEKSLRIWFQNRRAKAKLVEREGNAVHPMQASRMSCVNQAEFDALLNRVPVNRALLDTPMASLQRRPSLNQDHLQRRSVTMLQKPYPVARRGSHNAAKLVLDCNIARRASFTPSPSTATPTDISSFSATVIDVQRHAMDSAIGMTSALTLDDCIDYEWDGGITEMHLRDSTCSRPAIEMRGSPNYADFSGGPASFTPSPTESTASGFDHAMSDIALLSCAFESNCLFGEVSANPILDLLAKEKCETAHDILQVLSETNGMFGVAELQNAPRIHIDGKTKGAQSVFKPNFDPEVVYEGLSKEMNTLLNQLV